MPGIFTVDVSITSPIGCTISETFPDLIQIEPSPNAGFSFFPEEISILEPEVFFTDESQGAAGIYWTFGDGDFSSMWNPSHTYSDTGLVAVTQIVTHLSGCKDTLIQYVDIKQI
jgi:PKD repeat protein